MLLYLQRFNWSPNIYVICNLNVIDIFTSETHSLINRAFFIKMTVFYHNYKRQQQFYHQSLPFRFDPIILNRWLLWSVAQQDTWHFFKRKIIAPHDTKFQHKKQQKHQLLKVIKRKNKQTVAIALHFVWSSTCTSFTWLQVPYKFPL